MPYLLTPRPHYEQRLLTAALGVHLPEMWPSVSVYPGPWPVVSPEGLVVVIPGGDYLPRHSGLQLILEVTHLVMIKVTRCLG